ncbi:hypothetical protein [Jannaschia formosa]|uniref:hypothetical protein n=1 Tax=Jannaschia formosa TaxID=2259592 RepID=UPI000E1BDE66|nr:hypothetical protein [Jannaschia formosa]TFL17126.1 hypothetical protein DR046_16440 [Jannaschia formosa]
MPGPVAAPPRRGRIRRGLAAALAGSSAIWVGVTSAQEGVPNPALVIDLGVGLEADGDGPELRGDVGLSYLTRTRSQSFELSLGSSVRVGEDGIGDEALLPVLRTVYGFDNGATLLSLSGGYTLREVEGLSFLLTEDLDGDGDPGFDTVGLVEDDGLLETVSANLALSLWRRSPVGLELGADLLRRDYRDTSDPDLDDSRRVGASAALRLTPREGLDFRLTASHRRESEDDLLDRETETTRLGAGVDWRAAPGTAIDLTVARSVREEDRLAAGGGRETIRTTGLVWEGGIAQDRRNGRRGLRFARTLVDDGDRLDDLELFRALDLAGGGALSLGVGLARFEDGDLAVEARAAYSQPLAQGARLTASLSRQAGTDGEDQEVARSQARIGFDRPLSPVAGVGISARLARIEVIDGVDPDQTAISVAASYRHALTPDWSLRASVTHDAARPEGGDTDRDTRLSLGLGRSFTFRP